MATNDPQKSAKVVLAIGVNWHFLAGLRFAPPDGSLDLMRGLSRSMEKLNDDECTLRAAFGASSPVGDFAKSYAYYKLGSHQPVSGGTTPVGSDFGRFSMGVGV